jgi:hypothetical protein
MCEGGKGCSGGGEADQLITQHVALLIASPEYDSTGKLRAISDYKAKVRFTIRYVWL